MPAGSSRPYASHWWKGYRAIAAIGKAVGEGAVLIAPEVFIEKKISKKGIGMSIFAPEALAETIGSTAADTLSRAVVHAILAAVGDCRVKSYCEQFPQNCAK